MWSQDIYLTWFHILMSNTYPSTYLGTRQGSPVECKPFPMENFIINQNGPIFWSNDGIFYKFYYLECPKPVLYSLFYDWILPSKLFGLGVAIKPGEEEGGSPDWLLIDMFVEQPPASQRPTE